ncbi:5-formyltetrahydrofolate cyclo-ligase [Paraurantiacibacter namhicola]|nr:5-formyltetrahydrofolate cyclo-ligase [Paraurantiacibacter namhicola]
MDIHSQKRDLRAAMRRDRREHAAALPAQVSALVFSRPPAPLMELVREDAVIGLYHAVPGEAPAQSYARYFQDNGHKIALPRIEDGDGAMTFRIHTDPWELSDLVEGPHGTREPAADAEICTPDVVFVPLVAFTDNGWRLGQGGGYYDRFLSAHPVAAIGMAWDMQYVNSLPREPHDEPLTAIVTPTRIYGPYA